MSRELPHVGWREWVSLPDLGIGWIKVKVDTGARSSALHAFDVQREVRNGEPWVRFGVHPFQRTHEGQVTAAAAVLDQRDVRSSSGEVQTRYVVQTDLLVLGTRFPIELTLADRDSMGFRMLLGRQAVRNRFLVDPGRSYLSGRPSIDIRRTGRRRQR